MGNSLEKSVKSITRKRLTDDPYLTGAIACPICKQDFNEGDTHYSAILHTITCYLQAKGTKISTKPKKIIKRKVTKVVEQLKTCFNKLRINWQEGSDEIYIDRSNLLENSLLQIEESKELVNLHKVKANLEHRNGRLLSLASYQVTQEGCFVNGCSLS
jgi:hypothetical protein